MLESRGKSKRDSVGALAPPPVTQVRSVMIFRSDPRHEVNLNGGATPTALHTSFYSS